MQNQFNQYLEQTGEYGVVKEIKFPLAVVSGLPNAKLHELVIFESGHFGEVFQLNKDDLIIVVFSIEALSVNARLTRTNNYLSVPVGEELLGFTINPLGQAYGKQSNYIIPTQTRSLQDSIIKMNTRARIKQPLHTGVALVDLMIPLGKGQRELIIGDRKTGKSSFLLSTIKTQIQQGSIVIYAAIGRKSSDIKKLQQWLDKESLTNSVVIIATQSQDSPSLIYLTPYSAMSLAEYYRDLGKDVLVVMDDLSTHAKFYREVSLIAQRFPGRESYPGDIFYTHARLIERAGNFIYHNDKDVSITCLPIVEIVEGDLAGYISTNVMSMTDGHIYFDSDAYYNGKRPAINIPLSVTRVGKQTQTPLGREINRELAAFLVNYESIQNFSHFGAELGQEVKKTLRIGANIYNLFNQHYTVILPYSVQIILFGLIWHDILQPSSEEQLHNIRLKFIESYQDIETKNILDSIITVDTIKQLNQQLIIHQDLITTLCTIEKN